MNEDSKRALRRSHDRRMKAKAVTITKNHGSTVYRVGDDELVAIRVKQHDYLATCSCAMCGNPRRSVLNKTRLTKAERIAAEGDTPCWK